MKPFVADDVRRPAQSHDRFPQNKNSSAQFESSAGRFFLAAAEIKIITGLREKPESRLKNLDCGDNSC